MDPNRLLISIQAYSDGMAPYGASVWALIDEKGIKGVITTRKKAREFFLKKIVAVDGLNQGHNGGRAPVTFAEQRTNLGTSSSSSADLGRRRGA